MSTETKFDLIRAWAEERGLYAKGDVKTQYVKLGEEFGELGKSIIQDNSGELVDAIGDMVVVLTNLAHLAGFKIEDCIDAAYDEIKDRKGKMVGGSFVKQGPVNAEEIKLSGSYTGRVFRCDISPDVEVSQQLQCNGFYNGETYREVSNGKPNAGLFALYLENNIGSNLWVDSRFFLPLKADRDGSVSL